MKKRIISLVLSLAIIAGTLMITPAQKASAAENTNVAGETYTTMGNRITSSNLKRIYKFQISDTSCEVDAYRKDGSVYTFDIVNGADKRTAGNIGTYNSWISKLPKLGYGSSDPATCQNTVTMPDGRDYLIIGQVSQLSANAAQHYTTLAIEIGRKKDNGTGNSSSNPIYNPDGSSSTYHSSSDGYDSIVFQTPTGKSLRNFASLTNGVGSCYAIEFSEESYLYSYWLVSVEDFTALVDAVCRKTGTNGDSSWSTEITNAKNSNVDMATKMYFKMNKIIGTHTDSSSYKLYPSDEARIVYSNTDGKIGYLQALTGVTYTKSGDGWKTSLTFSGYGSDGYKDTSKPGWASVRDSGSNTREMPDDSRLGTGTVGFTYSDWTKSKIKNGWHQDVLIALQKRAFLIQYIDSKTGEFIGGSNVLSASPASNNGAQIITTHVSGAFRTCILRFDSTKMESFKIDGLEEERNFKIAYDTQTALDMSIVVAIGKSRYMTGRNAYADWYNDSSSKKQMKGLPIPSDFPNSINPKKAEKLAHAEGGSGNNVYSAPNTVEQLNLVETYDCFVFFIPVEELESDKQIYVKYFDVDSGKYLKDISDYWTDSSTVENSISLCI